MRASSNIYSDSFSRHSNELILPPPHQLHYLIIPLGAVAPAVPFCQTTGKPVFSIELSTGRYPNLKWKKGKFQGVKIWKDSGDVQAFKKLERDMRPDYIDKSNLPAAGASKVWKYKMIYLVDDEVVGNWSAEATVTVYGDV